MNTDTMYYRYFIYSSEEESMRMKIHGTNAEFGIVYVNGVPKRYTSIVSSMDNTKPDAIILIKGDIRRIKHTPPKK